MSTRMVITDNGREWLARYLSRSHDWVPAGYRIFHHAKWGEGGWEEVNGVKEPKDPNDHVAENDLDVVINTASYPADSQYVSSEIPVDLSAELVFIDDGSATVRIKAVLEESEENSDGSDNPDFWEVAIFDNGHSMADATVRNETAITEDNMILYATFDAVAKTSTRTFSVDFNLPWML